MALLHIGVRRLIIGLILGCVIVGAAAYGFLTLSEKALSEPDQKIHTVTLTKDGFSPAEITIRRGEHVTFVTKAGKPFWPASDLHPTHSLYEEFDPKMPVLPEKSWGMTFDENGSFTYHDHLDPQRTGTVTVIPSLGYYLKKDVPCERQFGSEKLRCFDKTLQAKLQDGGVSSAFEYFKEIYAVDPEVPSQCHQWTHRLGEAEYAKYKEEQQIQLRPEASFCSYGYFHGFINAMVADTQSLLSAQKFCTDAVEKSSEELSGMSGNCIHGIGHSVATLMLENQQQWGSMNDAIERGSKECVNLYDASSSLCLDGMFHEFYLSMARGDYGLGVDEYAKSGDLFYYCKELTGQHLESCHSEFIKLWPYFLGSDKKAAMENLLTTAEDVFVQTPRVLHTLARSFIEMDIVTKDFKGSVEACEVVPNYLFEECLQGLALGFTTHGEPGLMHEAGFAFCSDHYDKEDRLLCMGKMIEQLRFVYTEEEVQSSCMQLQEGERPSACS